MELSYSSCAISTKSTVRVSCRCGCSACSASSARCTPAPTSTSLAPRARETSKPITGLPSSSAAVRGSATVSLTWASWSRRMRRPPETGISSAAICPAVSHSWPRVRTGLLGAAQLGAPARALQLHLAQLARDLGRRHAQGLEPERVERHAHLARGPAHAADRAHAGHGQQAARELVVHEPGQLLLVELARRDGERQDGLAGELQLGDHGVAQVRRQVGAHARDGRAHVVHRLLYWFFQLVLGGDGGRAVHQRGGDVLEPLRGGDGVLDLARHVRFELPRRRARQRGRDHDHGQVHVGEVLHLHGAEGQQPGQREQHEQHGRRHGVPDRPGGEVHGLRSLFGSW